MKIDLFKNRRRYATKASRPNHNFMNKKICEILSEHRSKTVKIISFLNRSWEGVPQLWATYEK